MFIHSYIYKYINFVCLYIIRLQKQSLRKAVHKACATPSAKTSPKPLPPPHDARCATTRSHVLVLVNTNMLVNTNILVNQKMLVSTVSNTSIFFLYFFISYIYNLYIYIFICMFIYYPFTEIKPPQSLRKAVYKLSPGSFSTPPQAQEHGYSYYCCFVLNMVFPNGFGFHEASSLKGFLKGFYRSSAASASPGARRPTIQVSLYIWLFQYI